MRDRKMAWYLIWETVLNTLAELTYFADRSFYDAWWNSGTSTHPPTPLDAKTSQLTNVTSLMGPIRPRLEPVSPSPSTPSQKTSIKVAYSILCKPILTHPYSPVHNFLLRHVYHSSISSMKVNRHTATLITFFLSACVHELVMWCLFKKLRGYLLFLQMCQLPVRSRRAPH